MNKFLLSFMLMVFSSIGNAQITKGNWIVGGSATFLKQEIGSVVGENKITRILATPNIGYFFIDKFSAGLKPSLDINKINTGGNKSKQIAVGIGPFVRYYFLPADNTVNLFAETDYQYLSGSKGFYQSLYLFSAGPVIYFNTSVGLEFTLNYQMIKYKGVTTSAKTFFLGVGFQIHLEK